MAAGRSSGLGAASGEITPAPSSWLPSALAVPTMRGAVSTGGAPLIAALTSALISALTVATGAAAATAAPCWELLLGASVATASSALKPVDKSLTWSVEAFLNSLEEAFLGSG